MNEVNRIRWRCRRGMLELDIVLQRFLDNQYARLSESQYLEFETLLSLPDHDLWAMIVAKNDASDTAPSSVLELLRKS
ncbi:MAG: succinate dehydrogenase assembly factor 2 [Nitrosomonas sp.]|nr:succinate dehydrogenase assembly factor 2 [Nitrosomonas sp.]